MLMLILMWFILFILFMLWMMIYSSSIFYTYCPVFMETVKEMVRSTQYWERPLLNSWNQIWLLWHEHGKKMWRFYASILPSFQFLTRKPVKHGPPLSRHHVWIHHSSQQQPLIVPVSYSNVGCIFVFEKHHMYWPIEHDNSFARW